MNRERYSLDFSSNFLLYTFDSVKEGTENVPMEIVYSEIDLSQLPDILLQYHPLFNLALTGSDPETKQQSDSVNLNRGDRDKILTTVAKTIFMVREAYPDASIFFSGSDYRRNLFYGRIISSNLETLLEMYDVKGITNDMLCVFSNKVTYEAFLLCRKK